MVVICTSTTVPINSRNDTVSEALTTAEFWAVMEHKCRNPVKFVNVITNSRVVHEERDQTGQLTALTRLVTIKDVEHEVEETAVLKKPVMVSTLSVLVPNIIACVLACLNLFLIWLF